MPCETFEKTFGHEQLRNHPRPLQSQSRLPLSQIPDGITKVVPGETSLVGREGYPFCCFFYLSLPKMHDMEILFFYHMKLRVNAFCLLLSFIDTHNCSPFAKLVASSSFRLLHELCKVLFEVSHIVAL